MFRESLIERRRGFVRAVGVKIMHPEEKRIVFCTLGSQPIQGGIGDLFAGTFEARVGVIVPSLVLAGAASPAEVIIVEGEPLIQSETALDGKRSDHRSRCDAFLTQLFGKSRDIVR